MVQYNPNDPHQTNTMEHLVVDYGDCNSAQLATILQKKSGCGKPESGPIKMN